LPLRRENYFFSPLRQAKFKNFMRLGVFKKYFRFAQLAVRYFTRRATFQPAFLLAGFSGVVPPDVEVETSEGFEFFRTRNEIDSMRAVVSPACSSSLSLQDCSITSGVHGTAPPSQSTAFHSLKKGAIRSGEHILLMAFIAGLVKKEISLFQNGKIETLVVMLSPPDMEWRKAFSDAMEKEEKA